MNLTFLNPLFLWGLPAVALPILIHRLTQRKALQRKFSAVRLILQSQRITARPQRLKHLLLLALRILAVISFVFMMARPVLTRPGLAALRSGGARVVIFDNSLSMGFGEDRGERFQIAKKAVREALEGFEGQVAFLPTVESPGTPGIKKRAGWMKPEEALTEMEALPLSFGRGQTASAFGLAYQYLKDLKVPKQVLVVSDMARGDWEPLDLSKLGTVSDAEVTFLRIGRADRDPNLCVRNASLVEGDPVVGTPARLEVTVSNFSDQAATPLAQLYLSGTKIDQKSVELKPGEDGRVHFELFFDKPGWIDGEVRLSGDRLPQDDVFYFSLKVREKLKVLVVDGDPKTSLRASGSYYIVSALLPGGLDGSPFLVRVATEEEMAGVDLKGFDALFLLNVGRVIPSRLSPFLDQGKPAFVFLGNRVSPDDYNGLSFFPWRIGERMDAVQRPERIGQIDSSRETLQSLAKEGDSLKKASFYRYFRIEGPSRNLLTLTSQDPLLAEASVGRSKLFLFTSSANLDWNDLPLTASFLPLVQGLIKETVGLSRDSLPAGSRVGELFPEKARPIQLKGSPGGTGIYQFFPPSGEVRRGLNPPYEESNLLKMGESELKKKFGTIDARVLEYEEGTLRNRGEGRKELWPPLLVLLLVVISVEMVLANGGPWPKS
jgi:hypothetical protein